MKQFLFFTLLLSCACVVAVWPAQLSTAQTDHRSPITKSPITDHQITDHQITDSLLNKIDSGKAAIYKEIARIKASKPRVVVRNHVRTVYKDVPTIIFLDTCLTKIKPAEFLPEPETIPDPDPELRNPFFKRLIKKIFHGKN